MGGAQWDESVDVELAYEVVKYLMDSPIPGEYGRMEGLR